MASLGQYDNPYLQNILQSEPGSEYNVKPSTSRLGAVQPKEVDNGFTYDPSKINAPSEDKPSLGSDLRKTFLASTVGLGGAVIESGRQLGVIPEDVATREQLKGAESQKRLTESASPAFKAEAAKQLFDEEGNFTGEFSGTTLAHRLTASAPDILATLLPAAGISKVTAASKIASKLGLAKLGAAASEGLIAGAEGANQARQEALATPLDTYRKNPLFLQELNNLDHSLPLEDRENQVRNILADRAANEVFTKTALSTGAIGAVTGGGVLGSIVSKNAGKITSSYLKAVGKDFASEAAQELAQSSGEQYIQNQVKKDYIDPSTDVYKGVLNAAAEGALTGGVMGGGLGAVHNISSPFKQKDEQGNEAKEVTLKGNKIESGDVKKAISAYANSLTTTISSEDENYKKTYNSTISNLNNIIIKELAKGQTDSSSIDNIKVKEAMDALAEINAVHESRLRTDKATKEVEDNVDTAVKQGQEEAKQEETPVAPTVPVAPVTPTETTAPKVGSQAYYEQLFNDLVSNKEDASVAVQLARKAYNAGLIKDVKDFKSFVEDPTPFNKKVDAMSTTTVAPTEEAPAEQVAPEAPTEEVEEEPAGPTEQELKDLMDSTSSTDLSSIIQEDQIEAPKEEELKTLVGSPSVSPLTPQQLRDKLVQARSATPKEVSESSEEFNKVGLSNIDYAKYLVSQGEKYSKAIGKIYRSTINSYIKYNRMDLLDSYISFLEQEINKYNTGVYKKLDISDAKKSAEAFSKNVEIQNKERLKDLEDINTPIQTEEAATTPVAPMAPVTKQAVKKGVSKKASVSAAELSVKQERVNYLQNLLETKTNKLKAIAEVKKKGKEINWEEMWEPGTKVRHLKEAASEIIDLQELVTKANEELKNANKIQSTATSDVSSSAQPQVRQEGRDEATSSEGIRTGRQETGQTKVQEKQQVTIDGTARNDRPLPDIIKSKYPGESFKQVKAEIVKPPVGKGKVATVNIFYTTTSGKEEVVKNVKVHIDAVTPSAPTEVAPIKEVITKEEVIQPPPAEPVEPELQDVNITTSFQNEIAEAVINIDNISEEVDPIIKADTLKKRKSKKVKVDKRGFVEDDIISDFADYNELEKYGKEIDQLTRDIDEEVNLALSAKDQAIIADLEDQLAGINIEINRAKALEDDYSDLLEDRQYILDKINKAKGTKSVTNKKTSKTTKKEQIETDEFGQEERFALSEWATKTTNLIDHVANKKAFDDIKAGISKLQLDSNLHFEYVEDFSKYNWDKFPFIHQSQELMFANGLARTHEGKTYIFINGSRFSKIEDLKGTIMHELVGHYGVRKIFDRKDGGNEYASFLETILESSLKADIFATTGAWASYLEDWKRRNVSNYHKLVAAGKLEEAEAAYQEKLKSLPKSQVTTIKKIKNGKVVTELFPKSTALRLTDEYVAELAKAEVLKDTFLSERIGTTPENRSMLRTQRRKVLENIVRKIQHFFKKIFGSTFDEISKEDIISSIAESYDRIFVNINPQTAAVSTNSLVSNQPSSIPYQGVDKYIKPIRNVLTRKPREVIPAYDQAYSLPNPQNNFSPFRLVDNEEMFAQTFLQQFGEIEKSDGVRKRIYSKIDSYVKNNPVLSVFTTFGNMQETKLYSSLQALAKGHIDKIERNSTRFAKVLSKLDPFQNQKTYEYFTTKDADPNSIGITSQEDLNVIVEAKQAIREMGRFLAENGIISKDSYEANEDKYLHVQYLKYIKQYRGSGKRASKLSFAMKKKPRNEMEALALGQIKDVGFLVPETYGVMSRDLILIEMFNTINRMSTDNKLHWVLTGTAQVRVGKNRLSLDDAHKQLNQNMFILNDLEENDQNKYFIANQIEKEAFRIQTENLATQIQKIEDKFIDEAYQHAVRTGQSTATSKETFLNDHYTKMPEKRQLGQLSGRYVRKEIANDLEAFTSLWDTRNKTFLEKFFGPNGTLERINTLWKWLHVAGNPASWVRNFFGNFSLLDLSTSTNSVKLTGMLFDEIISAIKNNPSEFWELSRQYGLFGTTLSANELTGIYDKYIDTLEAAQKNYMRRSSTQWDDILRFTDERVLALLKMGAHRINNRSSEMFAFLEGSFKTVAFRDYVQTWEEQNGKKVNNLSDVEKGVIYSKAANHANDAIFDYSQVPSFVKVLRRVPLGAPFLTFAYKAGPAAIKSMIKQPLKFAKYATLPALLTTLAMAANDWDDEDINRFKNQLPDYYRLNAGTTFLPFKDSLGRVQILPLDYLIPWSNYVNAARHVHDNFVEDHFESPVATSIESIGTVFKEIGFLGGPTPTAVSAMLSGKDSFSGRSIMTPGASGSQQLGELMTFAGNMMAPSWLSSHGWASKMYDTFIKDEPAKDRFGELKFAPEQVALEITGFGPKPVLERSGEFNRRKHFEKAIKEASDYRSSVIRNRSLSREDKASRIREANERIKLIKRQQIEERRDDSILNRF